MQQDLIKKTTLALRPYWLAAIFFSVVVNALLLVAPIYMLQIYDRVLTSGSFDTLLVLSLLAVALLLVFAAAEGGRRRVFSLIGREISRQLNSAIFHAGLTAEQGGRNLGIAFSHLARIQGFFFNGGVQPFFDAPFTPFFILVIFLIHPALGVFSVVGAVILLSLAVVTELASRGPQEEARRREEKSNTFLSGLIQQYNAIIGMGMTTLAENRWRRLKDNSTDATLHSSSIVSFLSSLTKSVRQILQVGSLGLGAYFVLLQEISPGAIIAVSIILGRALAPIDQTVAAWRQIVDVRTSLHGLRDLLGDAPGAQEAPLALPRPEGKLHVDQLAVACPGREKPLFTLADLHLKAGQTLLVIGASGGGKTSCLQTLSGVWKPFAGAVRLGGRSIHDWSPSDRGQYIGYLPHSTELLPGTVAENIARFTETENEKVFEAARIAGCHDTILGLKDGYDTMVGPGGAYLSAGQKQLIGLARAVFDCPAAIFLDEPTANLDVGSVNFFQILLQDLKRKGVITVIATHDFRLLSAADYVLTLQGGKAVLNTQSDCIEHMPANVKNIALKRSA